MAAGSTSSRIAAATTSTVAGRPAARRRVAPAARGDDHDRDARIVETGMAGIDRAAGADDHRRGLCCGQPELATPGGIGLGRRRVDVGRAPAMVRAGADRARPDQDGVRGRPKEAHEEAIRCRRPADLPPAGAALGVEGDDAVDRADEVRDDGRAVGSQRDRQVSAVASGEVRRQGSSADPPFRRGASKSRSIRQSSAGGGLRVGHRCHCHRRAPMPLTSKNSRRRLGCST